MNDAGYHGIVPVTLPRRPARKVKIDMPAVGVMSIDPQGDEPPPEGDEAWPEGVAAELGSESSAGNERRRIPIPLASTKDF